MTNTYDAIGRITQRRLGLNSNYDTALTYKPGTDGSQTVNTRGRNTRGRFETTEHKGTVLLC